MVRNSKKIRAEQLINSVAPQRETLTQVSLTTRNVFGNLSRSIPGNATASIFTCPDGYRLKIYTVQHTLCNYDDDARDSSYVYTNDLNLISGGTNIISMLSSLPGNDTVATKTFLKDFPYIILPGEVIYLRVYVNGLGGTQSTTAQVILNAVLEPLNN